MDDAVEVADEVAAARGDGGGSSGGAIGPCSGPWLFMCLLIFLSPRYILLQALQRYFRGTLILRLALLTAGVGGGGGGGGEAEKPDIF